MINKWPAGARSPPPPECGKKQWLRTYDARLAHTEVWATRFFGRVALNESSTSCANGHKWGDNVDNICVGFCESLHYYFHILGEAPCCLTMIRFRLAAKTLEIFEVKNTSRCQLRPIQVKFSLYLFLLHDLRKHRMLQKITFHEKLASQCKVIPWPVSDRLSEQKKHYFRKIQ